MQTSAAYIEQGEAIYVAASESQITEAVRDFEQAIRRAQSVAEAAGQGNGGGREPGIERTLADTQSLRRQLQQMTDALNGSGNVSNRGRDDLQRSTGIRVPDLETARNFEEDFDNVSDDVLNLFRDLRNAGVPEQAIDDLRQLASDVRASDFSGNPELLARESQLALNLVEQLELALSRASRTGADANAVRTNTAEAVPDEHRAPVANYYRRLGEEDGREDDE